jgi:TonB family protein
MDGWLPFLLVYSAQLVVVIGVATLAAYVVRVPDPAWRLRFWQAVGLLCLALPFAAEPTTTLPASVSFVAAGAGPLPAHGASPAVILDYRTAVLWLLLTGWVGRAAWLLVGVMRLRRLRQRSTSAVVDGDIEQLRTSLAAHAEFRRSGDVSSPVSFGLARPVILLPPRFWSLDAEGRRAVACHELLHVARRDWPHLIGEELARVVFWFHPAIWWLTEQIHSSREALVDRLVVARVGARRAYMSALLAFADADAGTPSLAFLRTRHLRSRLHQLTREAMMSRSHLAATAVVLLSVMAATASGVTRTLPLEIPLQAAQASDARLEVRLAEIAPAAGLEALDVPGGEPIYVQRDALVTGADVATARIVEREGQQFDVAMTFTEPAASRIAAATRNHIGKPLAIVLDGRVISAPVLKTPVGEAAVISGLTRNQARALAEHLATRLAEPVIRRTAGGVITPRLVHATKPVYNASAMIARIQGTVMMDAIVNVDGTVGNVVVVRSLDTEHGLDEEAIRTVKQWTFEPGTSNGKPVPVKVRLEVEFNLRSSK